MKLLYKGILTSLETLLGKQVGRTMRRLEAGTSVYLRRDTIPRMSLSSASEPQSLTNFLKVFRLKFPLFLCAVCFLKTLITVISCCLFASTISTNHDLYLCPCLASKVLFASCYLLATTPATLARLPHNIPSFTFSPTIFLHGWTRLWRSRCNLQDRSHASSHLSPRLHWHGRQLHFRDGSSK